MQHQFGSKMKRRQFLGSSGYLVISQAATAIKRDKSK
jgi:hypothetical protein